MENEKRKVGDYTVLCAVNIGSREIIFAENEQSASGERFLFCYGERNDIFERFTECAVGDAILMRHCSLQSASSKTPRGFGQRLKRWIFP